MNREERKKTATMMAVLAYMEEERNRKTTSTWVHSGRKMAMNNRQMAHDKFFK